MYEYKVVDVAKVVDGDTIDFDVDLGFYVIIRVRIRLRDIDTWEMWGSNAHELGVPARDFADQWLEESLGKGNLILRTSKLNPNVPVSDGGFGRWAGQLVNSDNETLSVALREARFEKR